MHPLNDPWFEHTVRCHPWSMGRRRVKAAGGQARITEIGPIIGFAGYAGMNQLYLHRFERSTRSQLIPWHADTAFHDESYPVFHGFEGNRLRRRVRRVPEPRQEFFDALLSTAASVAPPADESDMSWIEHEIRSAHAAIAPWMEVDPVKPYTNQQFSIDMAGRSTSPANGGDSSSRSDARTPQRRGYPEERGV